MKDFKFFVGIVEPTLTVVGAWEQNEIVGYDNFVDAEQELTNLLNEEISRTIDDDIVRRLTREINGGLTE